MIDFLNDALDLGDVENYDDRNKAKGTSTFRSFIMTEKADEAYNRRITNKICSEIRGIMGDIYIATPTGSRSANKILLTRRGGGDYQFELRINDDGTISVVDNSEARGFMRTLKDGSKKFIMLNTNEFYRTKKINDSGVAELIEWLMDNYDEYEAVNAAARDRREDIDPVARRSSSDAAGRTGTRDVTDTMRRRGIGSVSDFLRNGGNIKDLI